MSGNKTHTDVCLCILVGLGGDGKMVHSKHGKYTPEGGKGE